MKANLRGRVILPGDQDYNEVRKVYNGMIDRHPKLIVCCVNAADVRLAVEFARETIWSSPFEVAATQRNRSTRPFSN